MSGERDVDSSREHFQRFCQDTYITPKKNSKTLTQNRIDAIKAYLKNVTGWQQQVFGGPVDKAKLANFKCDVSFFLRYYYTECSVVVGCICSGDTLTFPHGAQVDLRAFAKNWAHVHRPEQFCGFLGRCRDPWSGYILYLYIHCFSSLHLST